MSMFSDIWGGMRKVADLGSHLHTIATFLGVLKGHDPATEAPAKVKGWVGFLGYGDERQWLILLEKLEQKIPGGATVISQFVTWHFRTDGNWASQLYVKWKINQFRSVIIDMGDSQGAELGDIDQTITATRPSRAKVVTKLKRKLRSSGVNNGRDLLVRMHSIIQAEVSAGRSQVRGFRKCLAYLKAAGVPVIDLETDEKVSETATAVTNKVAAAGQLVTEETRRAAVTLKRHNRQRARDRSLWQRLCNTIFPF